MTYYLNPLQSIPNKNVTLVEEAAKEKKEKDLVATIKRNRLAETNRKALILKMT